MLEFETGAVRLRFICDGLWAGKLSHEMELLIICKNGAVLILRITLKLGLRN
jgi:hypothetical protein